MKFNVIKSSVVRRDVRCNLNINSGLYRVSLFFADKKYCYACDLMCFPVPRTVLLGGNLSLVYHISESAPTDKDCENQRKGSLMCPSLMNCA